MPRRPRRRTVLLAAASTLVLSGGVLTADVVATRAVTAQLQSSIACAIGVRPSAASTHVDGFVPLELVAGSVGHASVTANRSGSSIRVDLHDVGIRGGGSVGLATAVVIVPWRTIGADATKRAASGQDALPSGLVLADDDGTPIASTTSRPGIAVAFDVDHDRSSITLTADGLVLAGKTLPLPSHLSEQGGTLGALVEPHTLAPKLPKGSEITDVASTEDGLRVAVRLDPNDVGKTRGPSCAD